MNRTIEAKDLTFGVEIETLVDVDAATKNDLKIGSYRRPIQIPFLSKGWGASHDGRLVGTRKDVACVIISPKLRGANGLKELARAVGKLKARGHRVNESCGLHINVDFDGYDDEIRFDRFIKVVSYLETAIYATTGTKRRVNDRVVLDAEADKTSEDAKSDDRIRADEYLLGFANLGSDGRQPTVEFRAFSGSLNKTKIAGWVQMVLGIVERCLSMRHAPRWKPRTATGGWARDGVGQTDVERLFGFLGWGPGYRRLKGGHMYGWLSDVVPQDEIKAEFRRMACKYDVE